MAKYWNMRYTRTYIHINIHIYIYILYIYIYVWRKAGERCLKLEASGYKPCMVPTGPTNPMQSHDSLWISRVCEIVIYIIVVFMFILVKQQ